MLFIRDSISSPLIADGEIKRYSESSYNEILSICVIELLDSVFTYSRSPPEAHIASFFSPIPVPARDSILKCPQIFLLAVS